MRSRTSASECPDCSSFCWASDVDWARAGRGGAVARSASAQSAAAAGRRPGDDLRWFVADSVPGVEVPMLESEAERPKRANSAKSQALLPRDPGRVNWVVKKRPGLGLRP